VIGWGELPIRWGFAALSPSHPSADAETKAKNNLKAAQEKLKAMPE